MILRITLYLIFCSFLSSCLQGGQKLNLNSETENLPPRTAPQDSDDGSRTGNPTPTPPTENRCSNEEYINQLLDRISLLKSKKEDWDEIIAEGLENFKIIEPIFKNKCYACHDSDRGVPWYGKPFKKKNPIYQHYIDGIAALDFSTKFPLSSEGSNNQISLLNAIKNAALDETMPLRVYTRIYPRKKITPQDKMAIKMWVEPLVEKIEAWEQKYIIDLENDIPLPNENCNEPPQEPTPGINLEVARKKVSRVFSAKCFRCHANGASKGGFKNMQDLEQLKSSKFVDLNLPSNSELISIVLSGEMPPSARDRLNSEEIQTILEWIQAEADTIQ